MRLNITNGPHSMHANSQKVIDLRTEPSSMTITEASLTQGVFWHLNLQKRDQLDAQKSSKVSACRLSTKPGNTLPPP